jgi:hypothetical protein
MEDRNEATKATKKGITGDTCTPETSKSITFLLPGIKLEINLYQ